MASPPVPCVWLCGHDHMLRPVHQMKPHIIPTTAGWDVRGAVHKIWAGARDYKALRVGVDPGSCDAIKAVLEHTRRYDEQYGHKVYLPQ